MRKNLGQHFLHNKGVVGTIIDTLAPTKNDCVVEIGPGTGVLTNILLDRAATVIAIEKDEQLVETLRKNFAAAIAEGRLVLYNDDIRDFTPEPYTLPDKYLLVGNIPYYITGQILRITLAATPQPKRAVFMVQKEVAERVVARDGTESMLSLSVKAYGTPRYIQTVKRGSFTPPPRVDSAILAIKDISRDFFSNIDEEFFFALVRKGFAHKRKLLKNNLGISEELLAQCNIAPRARAENLSLNNWKRLTEGLERQKG